MTGTLWLRESFTTKSNLEQTVNSQVHAMKRQNECCTSLQYSRVSITLSDVEVRSQWSSWRRLALFLLQIGARRSLTRFCVEICPSVNCPSADGLNKLRSSTTGDIHPTEASSIGRSTKPAASRLAVHRFPHSRVAMRPKGLDCEYCCRNEVPREGFFYIPRSIKLNIAE